MNSNKVYKIVYCLVRNICLRISSKRLTSKYGVIGKIISSFIMSETRTWRGVPLTEIYGADSPWQSPEFPPVLPSYNHTVLYHIPYNVSSGRPPIPQRGHDKWDKDYVRMPFSRENLYPVEGSDGKTKLVQRWDLIVEALQKPIRNSQQLADAILSYNTKFKDEWSFSGLHKLFNDYLEEDESEYFFNVTLQEIIKLALQLPELIQSPIPLLVQGKTQSVSLSQQQISSLLANAFFCTFPRRNTSKRNSEYSTYPNINFNTLYEYGHSESVLEKLKCLCHYFRCVTTKVPLGVCTFMRRSVELTECPRWSVSDTLLGITPIHVNSSGTIEDNGDGLIQIDFANKYLGGGVLNHGCVQEEIRFVICPELMISMLFTQVLKPNEVLIMIGCERYSQYKGYGNSFHWLNGYEDRTPLDTSSRKRVAVLALDALPVRDSSDQYRPKCILRELNKAFIGISIFNSDQICQSLNYPGIATGNWGCGAFGGSPYLKFLLQLMACCEAKRPLAYYTFNDMHLRDEFINIYSFMSQNNISVGLLYKYLLKFWRSDVKGSQLYPFIYQLHVDLKKQKTEKSDKTICSNDSKIECMETAPSPVEESSTSSKNIVKMSQDMFSSSSSEDEQTGKCQSQFVDLEKGEGPPHVNTIENVSLTGQTLSLFDEMSKFDQVNSKMNLAVSIPCNNADITLIEKNTTASNGMEEGNNGGEARETGDERNQENNDDGELNSESKDNVGPAKKMARKITDYFNKKF